MNIYDIGKVYMEMEKLKCKEERYKIMQKEVAYPKKIIHSDIVEIFYEEKIIIIDYKFNEEFIKIVRNLKYNWNNNRWERRLTRFSGSYVDRVAELGNELLNNGFSIYISDESIRNKAIEGTYEKECTKWITLDKDNKLIISWEGYSKDLYRSAKKIKTSKWKYEYDSMMVDIKSYKEVEVFAREYEFQFSKTALDYKDKYKSVE